MTEHFPAFAKLIHDTFQRISNRHCVLRSAVSGDALWDLYLASFPAGTDPLFKTETEHTCACCRQFVRNAGNVVCISEGGVVLTVWDSAAEHAPYPYNIVALALQEATRAVPIADLFLVGKTISSYGQAKSLQLMPDGSTVRTWNHLHTGPIPGALQHATPDAVRGEFRTTVQVFTRGLTELTPAAINTVIELVTANALYRGAEFLPALMQFRDAQVAYAACGDERERNVFTWGHARGPASRFRNTVIGTLVQALSEGEGVEHAVASFEAKVAPTRYKRTTALITPGMVKTAMATIAELGLEPALERRFARIEDIAVNDVLWVDGSVRSLMKNSMLDALLAHVEAGPNLAERAEAAATDITIDAFVAQELPKATSLELFIQSHHLGNFMSLTAPVHPEPKQLFRWPNDFAWSYSGNITDSIKERVKKAGGNVDNAQLRVSLSWFNCDDLDLHVWEPAVRSGDERSHIFFQNKTGVLGGRLDVDMNAGEATTREAVENISWTHVVDGQYKVLVHNYTQRETNDVGFTIEIECAGKVTHYSHQQAVPDGAKVPVLFFTVRGGTICDVKLESGIAPTALTQAKWGVSTQTFVKVHAVTLSPNFWAGNAVGNKHTFFLLDGVKSDEPTRGIYNEFLHPRLEPHRKVFEVIGAKTMCQPGEQQLSGLGFSSTKPDSVIVRAHNGARTRLFNIQIGGKS